MKDVITTLGTLIDSTQKRDAVHIAIAPVIAHTKVYPGQGIAFVHLEGYMQDPKMVAPSERPIGIVDPFLKGVVYPGQEFWMFLMPGSITSLRHEWTHPAFTEPVYVDEIEKYIDKTIKPPTGTAEATAGAFESLGEPVYSVARKRMEWPRPSPPPMWLSSFEDDTGLEHTELIEAAVQWVRYGNYKIDRGRWEGQGVPEEFWPYFENLTGIRVEQNNRMSFFSCSC